MEQMMKAQVILDKLQRLSPDKLAEVEDFVDFLQQREQEAQLTQAAARIAEPSFQNVWDNPEDADYDRL
jgi:hypothetical protein